LDRAALSTGRVTCLAQANSAAFFVLLIQRGLLKMGRKRPGDCVTMSPPRCRWAYANCSPTAAQVPFALSHLEELSASSPLPERRPTPISPLRVKWADLLRPVVVVNPSATAESNPGRVLVQCRLRFQRWHASKNAGRTLAHDPIAARYGLASQRCPSRRSGKAAKAEAKRVEGPPSASQSTSSHSPRTLVFVDEPDENIACMRIDIDLRPIP